MARVIYRSDKIGEAKLEIIVTANQIIAEFGGQPLTLRQIYYQFIARDAFPSDWIDEKYNAKHGLEPSTKNTLKNYNRLGTVLRDARYAGLIDWDAIEDRVRTPRVPQRWPNGKAALDKVAPNFHLDWWETQPFYVELWGEKDTLSGILGPIAAKYRCTMMINRGSSSTSAMKDSADRIIEACRRPQRPRPVILYVGDHDPSGVDMVRDVRARLVEFCCPEWLDVRAVALTMEQIKKFNPPPNPVKLSDSRAEGYIDKFGDECWEVEALPPNELPKIVESTLKAYIDKPAMDAVIRKENDIRERLKKFTLHFKE